MAKDTGKERKRYPRRPYERPRVLRAGRDVKEVLAISPST